MKCLKNIGFNIKKGMRLLPYSIVLFLFCSCNNSAEFITESLQETYSEVEIKDCDVQETVSEESIYVYVCGAVNNPGVYQLKNDSRVYEAVDAAGGFREDASRVAVNLAKLAADGQQIYIPTLEEGEVVLQEMSEAESGLININTADSAKLQELPGIGKSRADAIVSYRENNGCFGTVEDIMKVSGIKASVYEQIKGYITV